MRIDITPILNQKGLKLQLEGEEPFPSKEPCFKGPVALKFVLTNVGSGILVEGTVTSTLPLSCGNCLADFLFPVQINISEEFLSSKDLSQEEKEEIPPEELSIFSYGEDQVIDLTEAIRQAALLSIPMHAVCSPECKGLCQMCGRNKNEGDCGCREELKDERWAPLKALERFFPKKKKRRNLHA